MVGDSMATCCSQPLLQGTLLFLALVPGYTGLFQSHPSRFLRLYEIYFVKIAGLAEQSTEYPVVLDIYQGLLSPCRMHMAPRLYLQDSIGPETRATFCPFDAPRYCLQTIQSHVGLQNHRVLVEPYLETLCCSRPGIVLEVIHETSDVLVVSVAL